jgi:hypothetical protein
MHCATAVASANSLYPLGVPGSWSIMDRVDPSGRPNTSLNLYGVSALVGLTLMA